jgi:hypothetical protein
VLGDPLGTKLGVRLGFELGFLLGLKLGSLLGIELGEGLGFISVSTTYAAPLYVLKPPAPTITMLLSIAMDDPKKLRGARSGATNLPICVHATVVVVVKVLARKRKAEPIFASS